MSDNQIEQFEAKLDDRERLSGVAEVYRMYAAAYDRHGGGTIPVTVRLLRSVDEVGWMVVVRSDQDPEKVASSNFAPTPEAALAMVHWEGLE